MSRAGRSNRSARFMLAALAAAIGAPAMTGPAAAQSLYVRAAPDQSVEAFYAARGHRPLWLDPWGQLRPEARILFGLLRSARADGLDPERYDLRTLDRALLASGRGSPQAARHAEELLSHVFVAYVRDLRRPPEAAITWVDPELQPAPPSPRAVLEAAAAAPSLHDYLADMGWMHPLYAGLRSAIATGREQDSALLRVNLERARALPAPRGRYIVVNASAARLTAYEDGRIVDSMRVVVGKPAQPTPMMAAYIRYTSLNPYWNVPPDLAAERIAPNVLRQGAGYLRSKGYQLLSSWDEDARPLDPATVDWKAVADGRSEIRVRQLPGPSNAMGQMKFMFPNAQGIYLHDTPDKELLGEASRMFSGGCVRLEDAPRLARWLHGRDLQPKGAGPEQKVPLDRPVAVYLTYLTAIPEDGAIAYFPDVYGRDRDALVRNGAGPALARR
jgi:murein L,D-transpeptidase YcbB/YkuD